METDLKEIVATQWLELEEGFRTDSGVVIPKVSIAYEVYGTLNEKASNAVLLFHALTGSQHAHGWNDKVPGTGTLWRPENYEGWWDRMIGPGKPLDTEKYCIICANYLGSCYGTTGPTSPHPDDGQPWGGRFPHVTVGDQARLMATLLDRLGIDRVTLVGPSVGGLVALQFAVSYAPRVKCLISVGSGYRASIERRLSTFEQILAIELDPDFNAGNYYSGPGPQKGLAFARIIGHKAFVYQEGLERRARREVGDSCGMLSWLKPTRSTQSYMLHQGTKFALRFDANAYLRIADMWSEFDICDNAVSGSFTDALAPCAQQKIPFLVFSIDTDCCFRPAEQETFVQLLQEAGVTTEFHTITSEKGHDSFLLEPELYAEPLQRFLTQALH